MGESLLFCKKKLSKSEIFAKKLRFLGVFWSLARMGNWQLEVGKMALYLAMPVGAFYAYNQTEWFRNYLYYYEKKSVTPEMRNNGKQFEEFKAQLMEIGAAQNRLKLEEQGKQTPPK